jgi:hypothetical protein
MVIADVSACYIPDLRFDHVLDLALDRWPPSNAGNIAMTATHSRTP